MSQSSLYDLIASNLQPACYALQQQGCFGQAVDVRLPHRDRPNGCQVRIRVATGPGAVACRVTNTGQDHAVFRDAAKPLLSFVTRRMSGWRMIPNSSGTGAGKVFWEEATYCPPTPNPHHLAFDSLLQAVSSARGACEVGSRLKLTGAERWPSQHTDSGVYPVSWTVKASGFKVEVRVSNKGSGSDAFDELVSWVFDYLRRHNPDARDLNAQPRGMLLRTFSDVLLLEVPVFR